MRPAWYKYFSDMAALVATRATCDRKHVGAVIVKDNRVLSTGYNGSPPGLPHCDDVGHLLKDIGGRVSCLRTTHSEANAIVNAAKHGTPLEGSTIYVTASPCYECAKLIIGAGIKKVVYTEFYESRGGLSNTVEELFSQAGVNYLWLQDLLYPDLLYHAE